MTSCVDDEAREIGAVMGVCGGGVNVNPSTLNLGEFAAK